MQSFATAILMILRSCAATSVLADHSGNSQGLEIVKFGSLAQVNYKGWPSIVKEFCQSYANQREAVQALKAEFSGVTSENLQALKDYAAAEFSGLTFEDQDDLVNGLVTEIRTMRDGVDFTEIIQFMHSSLNNPFIWQTIGVIIGFGVFSLILLASKVCNKRDEAGSETKGSNKLSQVWKNPWTFRILGSIATGLAIASFWMSCLALPEILHPYSMWSSAAAGIVAIFGLMFPMVEWAMVALFFLV